MRVLHYRQTFSKLSETFLYGYLTELERQGVDCHVLTHERRNAEARPFANVTRVNYPEKWHPRRLAYGLLARAGIGGSIHNSYRRERRRRLAAVGRDVQPDVVHAHFGREGVHIAPVAKRLGCPLVVTFYGFDISSLPEKDGWAEAYREMWPRTDAVTVLSEEMKEAAMALGCPEGKIHIVRLSRDLGQFPFDAPTRQARRLLFVGRLTPKKARLDAVRALERANDAGADLQLDIVGDGELRGEVERYVEKQGLHGDVVIHGREPNERVTEHMQAADAFVLPSKTAPDGDREGTPTVLVEAKARGLPCVSTRHSGISQMIPEENQDLLAAEAEVDRPRFIKSHAPYRPRYSKVVYVVRDGRDVAVSYYHHCIRKGQIESDTPFPDFLRLFNEGEVDGFGPWREHVMSWIENGSQLLVVKYEDLQQDAESELRRILKFAGIAVHEEPLTSAVEASSLENMKETEEQERDRIERLKEDAPTKRFMRKGETREWQTYFDSSIVGCIGIFWKPMVKASIGWGIRWICSHQSN